MKKIISLIVFTAALVWTWNLIHSTAAVGLETHSSIQQKFAELIENSIKSKKPTANSIKIVKLWTENAGERKVKAVFSFKFTEPPSEKNKESSERLVQGEAFLYRDLSEDPTVDKWTLQSYKFFGDNLEFLEGSDVTPDNTAEDEKENESP